MSKQNTDEAKDANKKKVKIDGKEKWLLMDEDEPNSKEVDLQEIIEQLVTETIESMFIKQ